MEAFIGSAGLKASDLDFVYAKATQERLAALLSGALTRLFSIRRPRSALGHSADSIFSVPKAYSE
jgi:hypothetical protein